MPSLKGSAQSASPWFNCLHPRPGARARLICFPWCGGGSQYYARWGSEFKQDIEVIGVRLPGRESRVKEDLVDDLSKVTATLCDEIIKHYGDKPFSLFGHSMGAVLCYEAAAYLKTTHGREPQHLFFSAEYAPHSKVRRGNIDNPDYQPLHELTDTQLIDRIGKHGGTPKTFLENTDFMVNIFLPPYKNDLKMIAKYYRNLKGKKPFCCGVTALDGDRDTSHQLSEYSELTSGKFQQIKLPGKHFYLLQEENSKRVRDVISRALL